MNKLNRLYEKVVLKEAFEVYFQYNKQGNWKFDSLEKAKAFANKYKQNKPVIYDLSKDKPINLRWK